MKRVRAIIMVLTLCLGISACKINDKNHVKIKNREIFDVNDEAVKVHVDFLSSEYIEINYSGDQHFDLELEIWENGKHIKTKQMISDVDISKLKGMSIALDENSGEDYTLVIGMYDKEGSVSSNFTIPKPIDLLGGRVESTIREKTSFSDDERIALWGFHCFKTEFKLFNDSYEAAKDMEWSVIFLLRPTEEI